MKIAVRGKDAYGDECQNADVNEKMHVNEENSVVNEVEMQGCKWRQHNALGRSTEENKPPAHLLTYKSD